MYRFLTCVVVLLGFSGVALAQDKPATPPLSAPTSVTLTFNQEELSALVGLLDAAVKARGLDAVPAAASVILKLRQAQKEAAPKPAVPPAKPEEKK